MVPKLIAYGWLARMTDVPVSYWLLWCGLLATSGALVALLWTHWGYSRPIQKCAVLSLLVHVMLACLAMTVKIFAGGGGSPGNGPPVRVRLMDDSLATASAPTKLPTAVPALLEQKPPAPVETVESATELPVAPPESPKTETIEPPATEIVAEGGEKPAAELPADLAVTAAVAAVVKETAAEPSPHVELPSSASPPQSSTPSIVEVSEELTGSAAAIASEAPVAVIPSNAAREGKATSTPYSLRNDPGRIGLVEMQGGSGQTEAAVAAALHWLAAAQSPDGRWDASEYNSGQELFVLGENRRSAGQNADTGITSLALLAFMGAGHTHQSGDYQIAVRRGLEFLIASQAVDGNLFGDATLYEQMYCHSMSAFALAEARAMTGDLRLDPTVTKAISYSIRAQNPTTGGWRYRLGDSGDTSQMGWQIMALASAQRAGMHIPTQAWTGVDRFLQSVRRGNFGGLASYRPDSPASTSMTAEALYCRLLLTEMFGLTVDEAAANEATQRLVANRPEAKSINLYYWYYASLALHQRQQANPQATAAWQAWNDSLSKVLVETQSTSGANAGSWNPNCLWGGYGGRVYSTAMATMCLEVYYRYAPTPAERDEWIARGTGAQIAPK